MEASVSESPERKRKTQIRSVRTFTWNNVPTVLVDCCISLEDFCHNLQYDIKNLNSILSKQIYNVANRPLDGNLIMNSLKQSHPEIHKRLLDPSEAFSPFPGNLRSPRSGNFRVEEDFYLEEGGGKKMDYFSEISNYSEDKRKYDFSGSEIEAKEWACEGSGREEEADESMKQEKEEKKTRRKRGVFAMLRENRDMLRVLNKRQRKSEKRLRNLRDVVRNEQEALRSKLDTQYSKAIIVRKELEEKGMEVRNQILLRDLVPIISRILMAILVGEQLDEDGAAIEEDTWEQIQREPSNQFLIHLISQRLTASDADEKTRVNKKLEDILAKVEQKTNEFNTKKSMIDLILKDHELQKAFLTMPVSPSYNIVNNTQTLSNALQSITKIDEEVNRLKQRKLDVTEFQDVVGTTSTTKRGDVSLFSLLDTMQEQQNKMSNEIYGAGEQSTIWNRFAVHEIEMEKASRHIEGVDIRLNDVTNTVHDLSASNDVLKSQIAFSVRPAAPFVSQGASPLRERIRSISPNEKQVIAAPLKIDMFSGSLGNFPVIDSAYILSSSLPASEAEQLNILESSESNQNKKLGALAKSSSFQLPSEGVSAKEDKAPNENTITLGGKGVRGNVVEEREDEGSSIIARRANVVKEGIAAKGGTNLFTETPFKHAHVVHTSKPNQRYDRRHGSMEFEGDNIGEGELEIENMSEGRDISVKLNIGKGKKRETEKEAGFSSNDNRNEKGGSEMEGKGNEAKTIRENKIDGDTRGNTKVVDSNLRTAQGRESRRQEGKNMSRETIGSIEQEGTINKKLREKSSGRRSEQSSEETMKDNNRLDKDLAVNISGLGKSEDTRVKFRSKERARASTTLSISQHLRSIAMRAVEGSLDEGAVVHNSSHTDIQETQFTSSNIQEGGLRNTVKMENHQRNSGKSIQVLLKGEAGDNLMSVSNFSAVSRDEPNTEVKRQKHLNETTESFLKERVFGWMNNT